MCLGLAVLLAEVAFKECQRLPHLAAPEQNQGLDAAILVMEDLTVRALSAVREARNDWVEMGCLEIRDLSYGSITTSPRSADMLVSELMRPKISWTEKGGVLMRNCLPCRSVNWMARYRMSSGGWDE